MHVLCSSSKRTSFWSAAVARIAAAAALLAGTFAASSAKLAFRLRRCSSQTCRHVRPTCVLDSKLKHVSEEELWFASQALVNEKWPLVRPQDGPWG